MGKGFKDFRERSLFFCVPAVQARGLSGPFNGPATSLRAFLPLDIAIMSDDIIREILREANKSDLFRKVLLQARSARRLVQVFANAQNLDQSHVGFVRNLGEDTLLLQELTWEGEPDGTTAFNMRELIQVSENTRKLRRVQLLNEQGLHPFGESLDHFDEEAVDCVETELKRAQEQEQLVSLRISTDHDYSQLGGFVRFVGDGYVQLELITTAGEPDGLATLRMKDVACVMRDDRQHRAAMQYYRFRAQLYGHGQRDEV